jgi:hypothetical protein
MFDIMVYAYLAEIWNILLSICTLSRAVTWGADRGEFRPGLLLLPSYYDRINLEEP